MNKHILYPSELTEKDLPLIILADNRNGWIGFLIKRHSSGVYSHIMEMAYPLHFASQDVVGYREVAVENYTKSHITLKFWRVKDMTAGEKTLWIAAVQADLDAPWVARRYDFWGIIGQALKIRWLQNSYTKYCSERVADRLRSVFQFSIPKWLTPSEFNDFMNKHERFECIGYWLY